jgi:uncharacterized protein
MRDANREVVKKYLDLLQAMQIDAWIQLWAPHGVNLMPFALPGTPDRLEGREAIHGQFQSVPKMFTRMRFLDVQILDMADPGMFFVTFRSDSLMVTGKEYKNTYCGVFRIENGLVVEFREYFNPLVVMQAFSDFLHKGAPGAKQ